MRAVDQRLVQAAREGLAEQATELIALGADPNCRFDAAEDHGSSFRSITPLMAAAGSPRSTVETLLALLEGGADPCAVSDAEVTATWYAAGGAIGYRPSDETRKELSEGHPYLDWGGGDLDRLVLLFDATGDPNECVSNGRSLLVEACTSGDPDRVGFLISRGASPEPRDGDWSIPNWGMEALKLSDKFRSHRHDDYGYSDQPSAKFPRFTVPLFQAAASGSAECVQLILNTGFPADFRSDSVNALSMAASVAVVQVLWDAGVRPVQGMFGRDAIDEALEDGQFAVAEFLLDQEVSHSRYQEMLQQKLLSFSGVQMNPGAVELLLSRGAKPNRLDSSLRSPMHQACWQGDGNGARETRLTREVLELLIKAGGDVNLRDGRGDLPLHEAVSGDWGSATAARVLLERGAHIDATDRAKRTPLMLACENNELECVKVLLEFGASTTSRDRWRRTPRDFACRNLKNWQDISRSRLVRWAGDAILKAGGVGMDDLQVSDLNQKYIQQAEEILSLFK